jgi:HlyD family secretion protein
MHRTARTLLIATLLTLGACQRAPSTYQGYAEGDYLYLASPDGGYLESLDAPRGRRVAAGDLVYRVGADPDAAHLSAAEASAGAAAERWANLKAPHRDSEVATLEANVRAAEAARTLAATQLERTKALYERRLIAASALDEAESAEASARANVDAARAALATYRSAVGRTAEVAAAKADAKAADASATALRWQVAHKSGVAPADGEIADTYFRPGEWVPAGTPVASLLPDGRRRIRFFVPTAVAARLSPGQRVSATCTGCAGPIGGTIDYIAPEAEYTPPVIYSRSERERLVFRIEAAPDPAVATQLRPGIPLDVALEP